jgi:hypothetical protein
MTDTDTGKPYARVLSAWELNLVLSQLQALDGETLNAREIAPFVIRTPGVSQANAERIAEKQAGLHHVARHGTQALIDMANANVAPALVHAVETFKNGGKVRGVVHQRKISADNLPKDAPEALAAREIVNHSDNPPEKAALCYQCGVVTEQRFSFRGQCLRCKNCFAEQCERVRCTRCGKVCTRPGGEHLCGGDNGHSK